MDSIFARHLSLPLVLIALLYAVAASAQTELIDQARAALNRGDSDGAIAILDKAAALHPKSADVHYQLATAYSAKAQEGGMVSGAKYGPNAKKEFAKAVELDPKHVDARFGLVQMYALAPAFMGGSHDKALEQAKAIQAVDPIVGHRAHAFVYAQQKKLDLAKKEFTDAIAEQPDSPKAHSFFGQYLASDEKNYAAAFAEFETALKVDPGYMAALYHLGRTAALANANLARGEEALRNYLGHTPKDKEPTLANAQYFLGEIYRHQGKAAEARKSYESALALNPSHKKAAAALEP